MLAALAAGACVAPPVLEDTSPRAGLFAVERAFAKASVEQGMRAAFLEYFADDGTSFQPEPVNTRQTLLERPAPDDPLAFTLDWQPAIGAVAGAGDLGFTMGPYRLDDRSGKGSSAGVFFSVWRREPDGRWKVVLDAGSESPLALSVNDFGPQPEMHALANTDPRVERAAILARERQPMQVNLSRVTDEFAALLAPDARVKRGNGLLIVGRNAVQHAFSGEHLSVERAPIDGQVAASSDLAYTYGRYTSRSTGLLARSAEQGYYVHLWVRDASKRWQILYELTLPLPGARSG